MHGELVDHGALLRAERADARSVKQPVRFQAPCIGRQSGAALRLGLRAHPPSDLDDHGTSIWRPQRALSTRWMTSQGGQFVVSPGAQFRMSFDS
jgi:hypothetical protein